MWAVPQPRGITWSVTLNIIPNKVHIAIEQNQKYLSEEEMRKSTGNAIEMMRIGIYVFFPVAVFYFFNSPDFFEKFVAEKRKKLNPPSNYPPLSLEENEKLRLKLKQEKEALKLTTNS